MTRRLLVYSPLAIWQPPIYETQLEIIQDYIERGYAVTMLTCNASLPTCEANPDHKLSACVLCRSRAKSGVEWLESDRVEVMDFLSITPEQEAAVEAIASEPLRSVQELRSLQLDGSDIGMAVLSSIVSLHREPVPDLEVHGNEVRTGLRAAGRVHYSIRNHIARLAPDTLLLFNGRVASLRPALRAGQAAGVETLVYEVAGAQDRYVVTANTYPHDLPLLKNIFDKTFETAPESGDEKAVIADAWYKARIENRPDDGLTFTNAQEAGLLPEQLMSAGLRVGIFVSSEDEFVAIDGWEPLFYHDQADGLRQLLGAFANRGDVQFILRVHPHLRGVNNTQTRELEQIAREFPLLHLVGADSPVHTYSLIEAVDMVLTFGSTVAMEAVYLGKPSLMLGRHIFEDMGGVVIPGSHDDLIAMLSAAVAGDPWQLPIDAREAVVRFGFAQSRFGIPYKYVRRTSPTTAVLVRDGRECSLAPSLSARLITAPERAIRRSAQRLRRLIFRHARRAAA
ncbi:MAG: hypothetical protein ACR2MQ_09745 [Gemmatimonadaceae bacterium]